MLTALISRLRASVEKRFPERHIYIRTHGDMRGVILTPARQLAFATAVGAVGLWTSLSVVAMLWPCRPTRTASTPSTRAPMSD